MAAGFDPAEAMARMRALAAARGGGSGRCALHVPRAPRLLLRAPPLPRPRRGLAIGQWRTLRAGWGAAY